jgi:ligand-binding SRPBCC domain-containing protein
LTNLLKISPPEANLQIFYAPEKLEQGAMVGLFVKIGPLTTTMENEIVELDPPHKMVDRQIGGYFAKWTHTHLFEEITATKTKLTDIVEYELPLGLLGRIVAGAIVRQKIEEIFQHRAEKTKELIENSQKTSGGLI